MHAIASRVLALVGVLAVAVGGWVAVPPGAVHAAPPPASATWTQLAPATAPSARDEFAMVYDEAHHQVVLFGGTQLGGGGELGDTWTWDGTTWTQHVVPGPPARGAASMAYDGTTGTVVLFGGFDGGAPLFDDTWVWNGTAWSRVHPLSAPPALNGVPMAWDPQTQQVVLPTGGATWLWHGQTQVWEQAPLATTGPAAAGAMLAFDGASRSLISFGGGASSDATWTWNGSTWTQLHPAAAPPGRRRGAMAYDADARRLVLFGGTGPGNTYLSDTWVWDGSTWSPTTGTLPPPARLDSAMAATPEQHGLLLFGGQPMVGGDLADTWRLTVTVEPSPADDRTPPAVSIAGVTAGAAYFVAAPTAGQVRCQATDASGIRSCTVSVSTSGNGAIRRVRYAATAVDNAGNTATRTVDAYAARVLVRGSAFRDGAFVVRPRHRYTLIVAASRRPTYLRPVRHGKPHSPVNALRRAGRGRWSTTVRFPRAMRGAAWRLGVRTGGRTLAVGVRVR
ncbi:Galactose oxidase, central domain [Nocardioides terrae]|uniref:Galactose oxidase, central domain n=1 Tax=Nocardioides terrae TaxID=574651 RepID=A0A1I1I2H4_9ACTN|nr:kelch repeat-containing protein [Nocardioides terrae]SFC28418.1 Galactose oxidase, central domain [Nocardioides terrae]